MTASKAVVRLIASPEKSVISQIEQLESDAFGRGGLNEWHLPVIVRKGRLYVLETEGKLVAAASLIRSWAGKRVFLVDLVVERSCRNRGFGRKIMEAIIKDVREAGFVALDLTVSPENRAAVSLYEGLGFKAAKKLNDEYGQGEDRLLFVLDLENQAGNLTDRLE